MRRDTESMRDVWEAPSADEFDALADLFLEPAARCAPSSEARRARVELVTLGHLPSVAGVWAGQYARRVAEATGRPVALARLRDDGVTVELFGAGAGHETSRSAERAISDAVRAGADLLLCVEERDESALLGSGSIEALNLLTGADQASLVGAYRKLKSLLGRMPEDARPRVRIAVVGAPAEKSESAYARLARSTRSFLSAEVERLDPIERIEPARAALLHRGAAPADPTRLIRAASNEQAPAAARVEPEPIEIDAEFPASTLPPTAPPTAPARATPPAPLSLPDALPELRIPEGEAGVKTGREREMRVLPDLEWLGIECPDSPGVSLALDGDGRLHLIARGATADAAMGLAAAKAWALRHAGLLDAACRATAERVLRADLTPTLTLLTEDARTARALLDTEVRVHLLVRPGASTAPLN